MSTAGVHDRRHYPTAERRATLQPSAYLERNTRLSAAGIDADDVRFPDDAARAQAHALGFAEGVASFPARGPVPPPPARDAPSRPSPEARALGAALAKARDLGSHENWRVSTGGAEIDFFTEAPSIGTVPALVARTPVWTDPAPRDLVAEHRAELATARSPEAFAARLDALAEREWSFLMADGVGRTRNETYGVQNLRRKSLVSGLLANPTGLPPAVFEPARAKIVDLDERLVVGRHFETDVGSHTDYWPYWDNYLEPLVALAEQTPVGSSEHQVLTNRIRDVLRRKTVFNDAGEIDESDFEVSTGAAVVHHPLHEPGPGHRVSLAKTSARRRPRYELLSVATEGLDEAHRAYAGAPVFRDGRRLELDRPGPAGSTELPRALHRHVVRRPLSDEEMRANMTLRPLRPHESARAGFPADWDGDGVVDLAKITIGWWGHCHDQAAGNALSIHPDKPASVYVADRRVDERSALQRFTAAQAWDAFGALAAGQDAGYRRLRAGRLGRPTEVGHDTIVGDRNDGGHWLRLDVGNGQVVQIDARVTELWDADNRFAYDDPMSRFRRNIDHPDGTFSVNPAWVDSGLREADAIDVDCGGRRLAFTTTFVTLDDAGEVKKREKHVELDPGQDAFVSLGEQLEPPGARRIVEHALNPKTRAYRRAVYDASVEDGRLAKTLVRREPPRRLTSMVARQESTYDSALAIHEFVMDQTGLPFTIDASSGPTVWNYAVRALRLDRLRVVERTEGDERITYSTYRLRYETVGGPDGEARYIIKRDGGGRAVASTALDPMPDFAFRRDEWVMAPVATDREGRLAVNAQALAAGYLTDRLGRLTPTVWASLGRVLYGALTDQTPDEGALLFVHEDGRTLSFDHAEDFERAVQADRALRRREDEGHDA